MLSIIYAIQGRNHGEYLVVTCVMVGRIYSLGGDRVKVSENFGAIAVVPVTPLDTSLQFQSENFIVSNYCVEVFKVHNDEN